MTRIPSDKSGETLQRTLAVDRSMQTMQACIHEYALVMPYNYAFNDYAFDATRADSVDAGLLNFKKRLVSKSFLTVRQFDYLSSLRVDMGKIDAISGVAAENAEEGEYARVLITAIFRFADHTTTGGLMAWYRRRTDVRLLIILQLLYDVTDPKNRNGELFYNPTAEPFPCSPSMNAAVSEAALKKHCDETISDENFDHAFSWILKISQGRDNSLFNKTIAGKCHIRNSVFIDAMFQDTAVLRTILDGAINPRCEELKVLALQSYSVEDYMANMNWSISHGGYFPYIEFLHRSGVLGRIPLKEVLTCMSAPRGDADDAYERIAARMRTYVDINDTITFDRSNAIMMICAAVIDAHADMLFAWMKMAMFLERYDNDSKEHMTRSMRLKRGYFVINVEDCTAELIKSIVELPYDFSREDVATLIRRCR